MLFVGFFWGGELNVVTDVVIIFVWKKIKYEINSLCIAVLIGNTLK